MVRPDLLRPFTVTFIPGAFAILPWVILLHIQYAQLGAYRLESPSAFYFALACAAITVGIFLEEFASIIETQCWDKRLAVLEEFKDKFKPTWDAFLNLQYEHEPIGLRYLRSVVLAMKFTTHFMLATVFATCGMLTSAWIVGWPGDWWPFWLLVAGVLTFQLTWSLSCWSCKVLAQIRALLVNDSRDRAAAEQAQRLAPSQPAASAPYSANGHGPTSTPPNTPAQ